MREVGKEVAPTAVDSRVAEYTAGVSEMVPKAAVPEEAQTEPVKAVAPTVVEKVGLTEMEEAVMGARMALLLVTMGAETTAVG